MSSYTYASDFEKVQSLGRRIFLKRLEDVQPLEDLVLHDSRWWLVTGDICQESAMGQESVMGLELEIAGPSESRTLETSRLLGEEDSLTVVTSTRMGLQFVNGVLQDTPWPGSDLIYVRDARVRGPGSGPDEKVYGIFILRYEEDGDPYYAPADRERQPGVASSRLLRLGRDLIRDWEPVDVAGLLERMESADG